MPGLTNSCCRLRYRSSLAVRLQRPREETKEHCTSLRRSKKEIVIGESVWSCSADGSEADTSTAILKSIIETLVFLCQQTCTVVLPRCGDWRSSEVRDALRSSSDSWSTVVSSGDSMKCREKASFFFYATTYVIGKIKQIKSGHNVVNQYTSRNSFAEMLTRLFLHLSAKDHRVWLVFLMPYKDRHCPSLVKHFLTSLCSSHFSIQWNFLLTPVRTLQWQTHKYMHPSTSNALTWLVDSIFHHSA